MSKPHEPLPLAQRRLSDAVRAVVDPVPLWTDGVCRWEPAVYDRLRASLRGQPAGSSRTMPGSRLPCRSAILSLLVEIDTTVGKWESGEKSTVERLRTVAVADRAPDAVAEIDNYTQRIQSWATRAAELLGDRTEVDLRYPCPQAECGRKFYYRQNGSGETVRTWTLRVSEDGARCQSCDATWSAEQFAFLARLLGLPALPS